MICPNCKKKVSDTASFCTACGTSLKKSTNGEVKNIVSFFTGIFTNPIATIEQTKEQFVNVKTTLILTAIVCGIMTFFNIIHTMISAVVVKSYNWFQGSTTTKIVWDNLGKVHWFEVIFKTFLGVAIFLAVIALIYYLGSMILKKTTNYVKLLGITVVACIPALLSMYLVSPIVSIVYAPIGIVVMIVGFIYSLLTLMKTMTQEISLGETQEFYFHFVSISIICSVGYFIMIKILSSNVQTAISNLFR